MDCVFVSATQEATDEALDARRMRTRPLVESLPPAIVSFVMTHLRSLHELQVLLHCIETADRWWDASALSRDIGISVTDARHALDHLARGNLLDIKITGDVRYSFAPGTDALRDAALACAAAFRARPVAVIELVADAPGRAIRDFANAFRIRRDDHS